MRATTLYTREKRYDNENKKNRTEAANNRKRAWKNYETEVWLLRQPQTREGSDGEGEAEEEEEEEDEEDADMRI